MTDNLKRPEGFRDQDQLVDSDVGIYGRDTFPLVDEPLPIIGVSGDALEGDDRVREDGEL